MAQSALNNGQALILAEWDADQLAKQLKIRHPLNSNHVKLGNCNICKVLAHHEKLKNS